MVPSMGAAGAAAAARADVVAGSSRLLLPVLPPPPLFFFLLFVRAAPFFLLLLLLGAMIDKIGRRQAVWHNKFRGQRRAQVLFVRTRPYLHSEIRLLTRNILGPTSF
jgi:hypothetical protein